MICQLLTYSLFSIDNHNTINQNHHHTISPASTFTMESDNDLHPKAKSTKKLQINNTKEFPALSSAPNLPTQKPLATPNWGSLFASQVPKTPRHPTIPPPPITPTKGMTSAENNPIEEKESVLLSPTSAKCMSIGSNETTETAVEGDEVNTPWDSPTGKKEADISVAKDEDVDNDATIIFPDFNSIDTSNHKQKELLPSFKFPATKMEQEQEPEPEPESEPESELEPEPEPEPESEVDLYNASPPKSAKGKEVEVEELCEAERHDTPSYIRGGLPLRQVVENDPHRVIHAIKHMMHGIVYLRRQLGAKPDELEFLQDNHLGVLKQIDILSENDRLAKSALEKKQAAIKEAKLAMEKERAIAVKEAECLKSECLKSATKFNPGAVSFDHLVSAK
ncbi:hypothetical protein NHQ30_007092 [Ciborinia camelliae]|nr:hypothetical protein NHQ30_007092 [Ciborinia camelliae]